MQVVICPHCGHRGIVTTKVPKEVVVVLPCPACQDWVVLFRKKVIGLKRDILSHGSLEERKLHIAEAIAQFLETGALPEMMREQAMEYRDAADADDEDRSAERDDDSEDAEEEEAGDEEEAEESSERAHASGSSRPSRQRSDSRPITRREVERFVRVELKMIDDTAYFRKHFS